MSNALSLTGSSLARKKSRDVEEDETIVIRTTEAKLREAEAKILGSFLVVCRSRAAIRHLTSLS